MKKPLLSKAAIWNMSVGFLGIQAGFALQNANASRILQTLGADTHELGWFWLVAPITGMVVQPIIGHYSDSTWSVLGRRKPFFLLGAILASIGLCLMPNAGVLTAVIPALWVGAGMLMIMDASFNIAMEPFRALVADKLSTDQRTAGFAIQTVLIGLGAVVGSWLPAILGDGLGLEWIPTLLVNTIGTAWVPDFLAKGAGLATQASPGMVPPNVVWAFIAGAMLLMAAILWTIITTKEYSPAEMQQFEGENPEEARIKQVGFLNMLLSDIRHMPDTMKQLGIVQFCSWFALFGMWVFTTPAIAEHIYGLAPNDTKSPLFNEAANQVGVLFGLYNFVSAIYAFLLPWLAARIGRRRTHSLSLLAGGIGLASIFFMQGTHLLVYSMIGVGMAWGSILSMPYAMLAGSIPAKKMGMYMGIFNLFITVPQITNGLLSDFLITYVYNGKAIFALVVAGCFMIIGAIATLFVKDRDDVIS